MPRVNGLDGRRGLLSADRDAMRAAQESGPAPGAELATALAATADTAFADARPAWVKAAFAIQPYFTPSDSLYPIQYQYGMVGNIQAIWNDFTGDGVSVGVYDTGVQHTHPDLAANYDASKHVVVGGVTYDGGPSSSPNGHGTHVAGIIAANATGLNGVGFAFEASLTGVNIFDGSTPLDVRAEDPTGFFAAADQFDAFDIVNASWGTDGRFYSDYNRNVAGSFGDKLADSFVAASTDGRNGLGTIIVKAAGNKTTDLQGEGAPSNMEAIIVAAARSDGFAARYSNFGSNVLVTAPGGGGAVDPNGGGEMWSTDLVGDDGYEDGDNAAISGTSMATPAISGIVALMLEANPGLGWRDVQEILAYSAAETGSGVGAGSLGPNEGNFWFHNHARTWNGGGLHFSQDYGFGMVDAHAAVRMAEAWSAIAPAQTSDNDVRVLTGVNVINTNYGATFDQTFTLNTAQHLDLEHVTLNLTLDRNQFWQMDVWLTSPAGTEVLLATRAGLADGDTHYDSGDFFSYDSGVARTWSYAAQAFRGEDIAGTWTVRLRDNENRVFNAPYADANANYQIKTLQLEFVGQAADNHDHYVYTDEFSLVGTGPRATLDDTNGGIDAIDAVAVTSNSTIDLTGGFSVVDGMFLIITAGTIEHVFGGDGNDQLVGNGLDNRLEGGRGNDTVSSGGGIDILDGGAGFDRVIFDRSASTQAHFIDIALTFNQYLADGTQIGGFEALTASTGSGADILRSDGFGDSLSGGGGGDQLLGRGGNDTLTGGAGDDLIEGGLGDDLLSGDLGRDTVSYADIQSGVSVSLGAPGAQNTGPGGIDTLSGFERLFGSGFGDTLAGDAGRNVLKGRGGPDTVAAGLFNDVLVGGSGIDTFFFGAFGGGNRASILDLKAGESVNLSALDADSSAGGDQAFTVAARFTGAAGELLVRYKAAEDRTRVMGDVDGDGEADFILYLNGDQTAFAGLVL